MDVGSKLSIVKAAANLSAVAADGSVDNVAVVGFIIDRSTYNFPQTVCLALPYTVTLASGKKLFIKSAKVEHGDAANLSDTADYAALEDSTGTAVATGAVTASKGTKKYNVHLGGAKRYIRFDFTPDLDASGTDTAEVSAIAIFGDEPIYPAI
jgi:CO dehydrogenase/acetyl-CoA synthase delta subunit